MKMAKGKGEGTVNYEDDCFGSRAAFRLRDIRLEPADSFDSTCRLALVYFTAEAAGAHANVVRRHGVMVMVSRWLWGGVDRGSIG